MDFRLVNIFTDGLAKLTGNEKKAAKTAAFDLWQLVGWVERHSTQYQMTSIADTV